MTDVFGYLLSVTTELCRYRTLQDDVRMNILPTELMYDVSDTHPLLIDATYGFIPIFCESEIFVSRQWSFIKDFDAAYNNGDLR